MVPALPADLASFVEQQVAAGHFASPDAMIQAGLQLLRERQEKLDELRAAIQEGLDDFERGEYVSLETPEDLDRFKNELIAEAEAEMKQRGVLR